MHYETPFMAARYDHEIVKISIDDQLEKLQSIECIDVRFAVFPRCIEYSLYAQKHFVPRQLDIHMM